MQLVAFETSDDLRTDGLFVPPRDDLIVVHVHGKCGNFYQNDFIKPMLRLSEESGVGFLAFNHRGHDCIAEAYRRGGVGYVGGSLERFADCILDIDAAVAFVRGYAGRVVIQGHSNGAEKALYYALNKPDAIDGVILLSPSDSYEMQRRYRPDETPEEQLVRLQAAPAAGTLALLPDDEYGIRSGDKHYEIPVTRDSLVDLIGGPGFSVLRLSVPWVDEPAAVPTLICLGEHDPYLTVAPDEMRSAVAERLGDDTTLEVIVGSDHHFHGREEDVVRRTHRWARAIAARTQPTRAPAH
jgi:pimeloyl-ACP methyl ester carboxylesterase